MKKIILIILDGLGDLTYSKLRNKTPLEYAKTPNMDWLSKNGSVGLMNSVARNITPESDAATMSMFGYSLKDHPGRGFLEALGSGIRINPKSILFRGNFCTVDKNRKIIDQRAGRISSEKSRTLAKKIRLEIDGIKIKIHPGESYRCVVEFSGRELGDNVSNTDPNYKKIPNSHTSQTIIFDKIPKIKKARAFDKKSERTSDAMNKFTEYVLDNLEGEKANCIILRDAGKSSAKVEPLKKKFGIRMLAITNRSVEKGIAKFVKAKVISLPTFGRPDKTIKKDSKEQLKILSENWSKYDIFYLFNKATDIKSHDGDFIGKAKAIGQIDKYLIGPLKREFGDNAIICVTADHSSPCKLKAHSNHPVPVLIYGGKKDDVEKFSEKSAAKGRLELFEGKKLIPMLLRA